MAVYAGGQIAVYQGTTSVVLNKLRSCDCSLRGDELAVYTGGQIALYQGTTSVVPKSQPKNRALEAAEKLF